MHHIPSSMSIFDDDYNFSENSNCWPIANNVTLFVWQEIRYFFYANEYYTYYMPVFIHAFDGIHKFAFKIDFIYFPYFDEFVFRSVHFSFVTFSIDVLPSGLIRFIISIVEKAVSKMLNLKTEIGLFSSSILSVWPFSSQKH